MCSYASAFSVRAHSLALRNRVTHLQKPYSVCKALLYECYQTLSSPETVWPARLALAYARVNTYLWLRPTGRARPSVYPYPT